MAALYQLALIVKNPNAQQFQFLVTRQHPPVADKPERLHDIDRGLWDLPLAPLAPADRSSTSIPTPVENSLVSCDVTRCVTNSIHKLGLYGFNVRDAVAQVERQVYPAGVQLKSWRYWKLVEESCFGPGPALHTLIFMTDSDLDENNVPGGGQWLDPQTAVNLLVNLGSNERRIGPLAAIAVSPHVSDGLVTGFSNVYGQEYPPGVVVVPMNSRVGKPFNKTNLVIFCPSSCLTKWNSISYDYAASGDVLIADPGCTGAAQAQLTQIVKSLPRKMLVFLTHHHLDHIEGLSVVRKYNPGAVLLAHEVTFRRIGKATKGFQCIAVEGESKLLVGGHKLEVVSAPGHTDGHLALYGSATGTLVVGDHCVGQGSSWMDPTSGGNLQDYLETTQRLLDLGSHILVPMHGRPNLWPAHMLDGYIKHRQARELKILKAVESGARSAFEVLSSAYADTPTHLWPWALGNVKLHMEHLHINRKLPEDFSTDYFERSSKTAFLLHYLVTVAKHMLDQHWERLGIGSRYAVMMIVFIAVVLGAVATYCTRRQAG